VTITGTATTSGNGGACRPIMIIATPVDIDHGTLKVSFKAASGDLLFEPAYHFAVKSTMLTAAQTIVIKP
jgi:hypothetical protein